MAIYRGDGGAGDADNDVTVTTVTEKALEAENSASEAAASATQSANSASAAATSASNAATSETNAANSATSASTSATNAAASATSASTSASNAASSASAASTSETNAASSASAASTSASNAATSETNAATSESNAASSASAASTSASNAATSASAASTSATNAATSATNAATSESNAATSASNAAASYDSFDDRYLGAKASDPTLDNDGDALITGALYFDTTNDAMKVYDGTSWLTAYVSLGGALLATNNLSDLNDASAARTNLGLGTAATTASTDYATAAQGTLADSAVQPADNVSTLTNDANYLTSNQTITLSGDATGSGTTAITVTVADDSHNHIISNVDGLQTALDAKLESFTETNDLTAAVTWANVPDANITQSSVTQHQAALSITESQISDLGSYLTTVALNDVSDVTITTPSTGQVLKYNGTIWVNDADTGGIDNVVDDTTPQLGGDLDLNSSDITGTGNIDVTGTVTADGLTVDTDTLHVDATNNQVGIGTATPKVKLHIESGSNSLSTVGNADADEAVFENNGNVGITLLSPNTSDGMIAFGDTDNLVAGRIVYSHSDNSMKFHTGNVERILLNSAGIMLMNTTDLLPANNNVVGTRLGIDRINVNRSGGTPAIFGRTNDGSLVNFYSAGTVEGSISVSGTTVSYNGGHLARWSQLADNTRDESIVKGTVMSNLDQMAEWTNDGVTEENEQLNCMKVSDVEGDANVAGVFVNWDNDDDIYTNDMNIAMTGDMVIRIAQGVTVQRGDLLMSAGDGTAKPQGDDIVRSKTIAKVTSTTVSNTYDDGSYLVPCVLMAC